MCVITESTLLLNLMSPNSQKYYQRHGSVLDQTGQKVDRKLQIYQPPITFDYNFKSTEGAKILCEKEIRDIIRFINTQKILLHL